MHEILCLLRVVARILFGVVRSIPIPLKSSGVLTDPIEQLNRCRIVGRYDFDGCELMPTVDTGPSALM